MKTTYFIPLLVVVASTNAAVATVGMAEWQVYTPGGHLISHVDGWKERFGDCLRSDDSKGRGPADTVFVAHLRRWRYYDGLVAGENDKGFFIFDERSRRVRVFTLEREMVRALDRLEAGSPESPWLTGADGWQEAWFPYVFWKPCRQLLSGADATELPKWPSQQDCRAALAPEKLELYRKTTWGRQCRRLRDAGKTPEKDSLEDAFCESLGF